MFSISRGALLWALAGVGIEIFAYPRWSLFPLAYPVLAFYLSSIYEIKNIKAALIVGLMVTMVAGFGAFHWVTFVLSEMGGFPVALSLLMHTAFNFIVLPNFNTFFLLGFLLKDHVEKLPLALRPLFWTLLWVALEFLWRPLKVFPEMVGNTQWSWLEISQLVSWGGVGVVSFLVFFCGACLFYILRMPRARTPYILLGIWALCLITAHFWGAARIRWIESLPKEEISVVMVQANIGNADKMIAQSGNYEGLNRVVLQYSELTSLASNRKPDLILWPETAFPLSFPTGPEYNSHFLGQHHAERMRREASANGYSLLVGGYENLNGFDYNSAVLIGPEGEIQTSYKKANLIIFGEYMPFADIWPDLKKLNPIMGDFGIGKGPFPIEWKRPGKDPVQLGVNICYEALIMPYMRDLARNGSQIYVNLTNDSWFGAGNEPYEHLELAVHRTIENGLPMIRATNTGISILLDATGKEITRGPLLQPSVIYGHIPIYKEPIETFYRKYGEIFSWILVLATLALGIYAVKRKA